MGNFKERFAAAIRGRGVTSGAITALFIGVLIVVNVIVYAIVAGFGLYIIPKTGEMYDFSVSDYMDEFLAKAGEGKKVKVLFCRPKDEMPTAITDATDEVGVFYLTANSFKEKYPDVIEFDFVNVLTRKNADGKTIDLSKYQEKAADGTLYPLGETSVIFISEDRHRTIIDIASTAFAYDETVSTENYSSYCGQEIFAASAAWVMKEEHKTVYFTTYHSETIDKAFSNMLACSGYQINTINLRKEAVPDDAALVVISNPITDFESAAEGSNVRSEIQRLRTYVEGGGKLYVSLDPFVDKLPVLEEFLKEYGISYSETELDGHVYRDIIKDRSQSITVDNLTVVASISDSALGSAIEKNIREYNDSSIVVRDCAALELTGNASALLLSSPTSATYAGSEVTDEAGGYCIGAIADSNENGGKIFVVPTVTLSSSSTILTSDYANREFVYSLLEYGFGAENVPHGCSIFYLDTGILQNLTTKMMRVYTVILMTVPVIIAIAGAVVVTRRKNR